MKILIVCDLFPPEFAPRMGYLCKYLKRMGHHIDVVCEQVFEDRRFDFLSESADSVKRVCFYRSLKQPKPMLEWGTLMLRNLLFHYKDKRFLKEIQKDKDFSDYDIVLCSTPLTFPLRAAAKAARMGNIPLVVDLRDIIEQYPDLSYLNHHFSFFNRWYTKRLLRTRNEVLTKAAAIVSISPWHVNLLKQFNPNTKLIYNGFDHELFFPNPIEDPFFRITFTGHLINQNNRDPRALFKAVSMLLREGRIARNNFRLCWYCDDETRNYVQKAAQIHQIEDITECSDYIPANQVPELLNRSSILLQLSNVSDEKGPKGILTTKFFEALAVGKPLLLTPNDQSFLSELIARYRCGLASSDAEEIAQFIEKQYNNWKQNGFTQVKIHPQIAELFSRKGQADQYIELFNEILHKDRKI